MIGKTLAHYEILSQIGKGGMGEVYQAKDRKLGRDVAIKVLPAEFARDTDRVARFQREAKLLASLNHPNIASIYGLEEFDGTNFLVMELIEGETLADYISGSAGVRAGTNAAETAALSEILKIALQIAEALEAAHEKGVIHRDLKPANIKVTLEGKVKVLDFGLAKAFAGGQSDLNLSNSPTLSNAATQQGVILGTAAYMSPEQARGKTVDKRTDIWAFGCVLFEMLAGQAAFQGEDLTEIFASVVKSGANLDLLPANLHPGVHEAVTRCLQKDLKKRYQDIGDVRYELEQVLADPGGVLAQPVTTVVLQSRLRTILPWAAAALVLGLIIAGTAIWKLKPALPPELRQVVATTIKIEPGHWLAGYQYGGTMERPSRTAMAVSSDGRFVVYSAIEENPGPQAKPQLYLRKIDQLEAKPIAGTEGGINPILSPDDRWVGFWADGKLKTVPVEGGVATTLCDFSTPWGASWGRDNSILFSDGIVAGISRVSAEGGKPEILTRPDPKREEFSHRLPSWLPNGKAVVFTVTRQSEDSQPWLALLRLDTREWNVLLQDAADARYVSTGHLVFLRQGTLMAVRFDPNRLKIIGQPVALLKNVIQAFGGGGLYHTGAGQFGVSETGSFVYAAGGFAPPVNNSLVWVDQGGKEQPVTALQFPFLSPRLSPDGQKIAYNSWDQVWVYNLSTGTNTPLIAEGTTGTPIWISDNRLLFGFYKSLASNLFWQAYDGSSPMERLTTSKYYQIPGSLSSDGETVAFMEIPPDTGFDIAVIDLRSKRVTPFLNSKFDERYPEFSPDGRWIAYSSDESKRSEVYVRPFPDLGMKRTQVSSEGGIMPLWARNGKQLFYRWQDQMWVVDVRTDGGFGTSKPRKLFEKPGYFAAVFRTYDLSLDGQRFLMVKAEQRKPTPVTEMILMQNWFEELKKLAPVD
jgi:serine/threonine protein kinase/Tol biopolymer transport system component